MSSMTSASGLPAPDYVSAEQAMTVSALLTLAHGLGVKPLFVSVVAICKTAEQGHAVGDELCLGPGFEAGNSVTGANVSANATNIFIFAGADHVPINKSTFANTGLTEASWRWIARAWK